MTQKEQHSDILMVVDIQPGYHQACHLILPEIVEKINDSTKPIIFFYVGKDCGLDDKYDVISFLLENGCDESKVDQIKFVEKDYAFFRNWMDVGIPEETILKAIRLMKDQSYSCTEQFTQDDWKQVTSDTNLQFKDCMFYPTFNQKLFSLPYVDNIEMIGGGRYECLEEIQLYLKSIDKTTFINESLCYGADVFKPKHKIKK